MNLTVKAAELRGKGQFQDAIDLALNNYSKLNDGTESTLLLEGLYSAEEMGNQNAALSIAKILQGMEPGLPALKKYQGRI